MASYWEYKNIKLMKYGKEHLAGPTTDQTRTQSDWHRNATSGICTYVIDGVSLAELRPEGFKSVDDLREFFRTKLFGKVSDADSQYRLVEMALEHFYQAGLPHATSSCIQQLSLGNTTKFVSQPEMKIEFTSSEDGVTIKETNIYRKWKDNKSGDEHKRDNRYYAKTTTTYEMCAGIDSESQKAGCHIKLVNLMIDCPSRNLAPIFDQRPGCEQMPRAISFLRELVASLISRMFQPKQEAVEESSIIYSQSS